MISIVSSSHPQVAYFDPMGMGSSYGPYGTQYWTQWTYPGLLIGCPSNPDIEFRREDVSNGYLHYPSNKRYGELRDRAVMHVHVDGTVYVDQLAAHSTDGDPGTSSVDRTFGDIFEYNGITVPYSGITLWGMDAVFAKSFAFPSYPQTNQYLKWASPYSRTFLCGARFDGDWAIQYVVSMPYAIVWSSGAPSNYNGQTNVRYIHRVGSNTYYYNCGWYNWTGSNIRARVSGIVDDLSMFEADGSGYFINPTTTLPVVIPVDTYSSADIDARFDAVVEAVSSPAFVASLKQEIKETDLDIDFAELGLDVFEQFKYVNSGLLQTLYELAMLRPSKSSWLAFAKMLKGMIHKTVSSWDKFLSYVADLGGAGASALLETSFGILPTASDLSKVIAGLEKLWEHYQKSPRRLHSRRTWMGPGPMDTTVTVLGTVTAEIANLPDGIIGTVMERLRYAYRWGTYPTFEAAWDFVPFSFVIDQIIDIQSVTEQMDLSYWKFYFPVKEVICSTKKTCTLDPDRLWPSLKVTGLLDYVEYTRWIDGDLPLPPISLDEESGPFSQWAEYGSLVVGFLKRR